MGYLTHGTISSFIDRTVSVNKANGWYDNPVTVPEMIALLHSEVSEALESWRNNEPISHVVNGKPEGIASEFADIAIRLFDYSHRLDIDLTSAISQKLAYNETREYRHGGKRN